MKKNFLILIALVVLQSASAQTNVYHPFPDSNAVWNFEMQMICFGGNYSNDYYSIIYTGDTTIGLYNYHHLGTPYLNHYVQGNCGSATTGTGFIRQDTALKKVFLLLPPDTTEQLLYDFTMQVGDTVKGYIGSFAFPPDVVQAIDSVIVGNNYRKRWLVNPIYMIYFIEGIGSTYGFAIPSPGNITDGPDYTLSCFSQNNQPLFPDSNTACEIIQLTNEIPGENISTILSPNPFHSRAKIEIHVSSASGLKTAFYLCNMKIYNSSGTLVRSEIVLNITPDSHEDYIINRNSLPDGMYFYRLTTNENKLLGSGRFVIE